MKKSIKRKPKLFARFRHSHLIDCGFRVDLQEDGNEFGSISESICFEILEATKEKLKIKLWHAIYENSIGKHCEDSYDLYEIDLTAPYNERNLTYIGKDYEDD